MTRMMIHIHIPMTIHTMIRILTHIMLCIFIYHSSILAQSTSGCRFPFPRPSTNTTLYAGDCSEDRAFVSCLRNNRFLSRR